MRHVLALGFAASVALVPFVASASDTEDALKLAARIAGHGLGETRVLLHQLPPGLTAAVPLPHAALLGSVVPTQTETSVTGIAVAWMQALHPLTIYYDAPKRANVVAAYESALRAAGWKEAPDITQRLPIPQGGFAMQIPHVDTWCAPSSVGDTVTVQAPQSDPTALDVEVASGALQTMACGDVGGLPFPFGAPKSPLPTFVATDGIAIGLSGPMSTINTTGARITSSLGLVAVFDSFAKQLRDAGWTAGDPAGTPAMRSQTFTKTVDGTAYVALLSLYALDATDYVALTDVTTK
jgi:hypothetical protein